MIQDHEAKQFRGAELVDHLINYHAPEDPDTIQAMTMFREMFRDVGHAIVRFTPSGADQTVAIRKLHEACQAVIGNLALNEKVDDNDS
jgi:hypothetical protein